MSADPRTSRAPVVHIDAGRLQGQLRYHLRNGELLQEYFGIPYAAPPVGELRWQPPQPVAAWAGIRQATALGANCPQQPEPHDIAPIRGECMEDCLTLNVWAPAESSAPLPVMVWIHGGGFVSGGSSPARYDGAALAARGVVVVSLNYRLGRLGFFAHPVLLRAQGEEAAGNFGLMDQLAALRWVQRNVAAFGGDPARVTVFGESAGGASIAWLMSTPVAQGLFAQAIVQSAPVRDADPLGRRTRRLGTGADDAPALAEAWARSVGILDGDDAAVLRALRALPVATLTQGLGLMGGARDFTGPVVGGPLWPVSPEQAAREGRMLRLSVLIGCNSDEMGFLASPALAGRHPPRDVVLASFGLDAHLIEAAYAEALSQGDARFIASLRGDQVFAEPTRFLARALAPHQPVFAYRFAHGGAHAAGALHATELPYVFDTLDTLAGSGAADLAVATQMAGAWATFAQTGNPGGWSTWHAGTEPLTWIDAQGAVIRDDPAQQRLDAVAAVHASLSKGL